MTTPRFSFCFGLFLACILISASAFAASENIDNFSNRSIGRMRTYEISPRLKTSELTFNYKSDTMGNIGGGTQRKTNYLGNFIVASMLNLEEIFGLPTTTFGFQFAGIHGSAPTDSNGDFQGASNLQATPGWNIYEAWLQKTAFDEKLSILAGLRDVNSDFNVTDSSLVFLNSSFGMGPEFSTSGAGALSTFPVTGLGARIKVQPTSLLQVQFGAFDGIPGDPGRPQQTLIRLSKQDGALLVSEISITPTINNQPGKFGIGAWMYTSRMKDMSQVTGLGSAPGQNSSAALPGGDNTEVNNEALAVDGTGPQQGDEDESPTETAMRRRSQGAYMIAEQKLFSPRIGEDEGLSTFVRAGLASPHSNPVGYSVQTGLAYKNIFSKNRGDQLGLGMAMAGVSSHNRRALQAEGVAVKNQETAFELTYQKKITTWLALQPDFQWILNPGFNADTNDAFVAAARIELAL